MPTSTISPLSIRPVRLAHRASGAVFEGSVWVGAGREVIEAVAERVGRPPLALLDEVMKSLLVKKGADWTATILGEYVGLYEPSAGVFGLVVEHVTGQLVAHAVVFQSRLDPFAGLLAHVRTADGWGGFGLGTIVTEEVTRAAFAHGAGLVVLETDDRLLRKKEGERAAVGMYGKIGYALLAEEEKPEAAAKGWLMVIDRTIFDARQQAKHAHGGEFAGELSPAVVEAQERLVATTRSRFSAAPAETTIEPVNAGDLAGLFLLLNLCPPGDFRLKLAAWDVVQGSELERAFVVNVRPALLDRDRLEDASLVLRDARGGVLAICAARLAAPFSRQVYAVDFYCLPALLDASAGRVRALIEATIARIREAVDRPKPCRLVHVGVDTAKLRLFSELGFQRGANVHAFPGWRDALLRSVNEYEKILG